MTDLVGITSTILSTPDAPLIASRSELDRARSVVRGAHARGMRLRRHLWQRLNNPSGRTRPAFVVGCGRSGTTLLVSELGRSWQVDLYSEDHPAAFSQYRLHPLTEINRLVKGSHAAVALFKPILETQRTHELLARFPNSRALFAFRHYDDVINSALKRFGATNWLNRVRRWMNEDFAEFAVLRPPRETTAFIRDFWRDDVSPATGTALYWLFYNRLYFDLGLAQDLRVRLVRYETLVGAPHGEFQQICEFLGIRFDSAMAKGVFGSSIGRDDPPSIDPLIAAACDELWERLCAQAE
jgi:hypothetical protein